MAKSTTVLFYIDGRKAHGIGYRVHLVTLALECGLQRFYAKNLPPERGRQKISVYAGGSKERIDEFYERVKSEIPKKARDVKFTEPELYHSKIVVPTIERFVSTLNMEELSVGVTAISGLRAAATRGFGNLSKQVEKLDDISRGIDNLPDRLAEGIARKLSEYAKSQNTK